MLYLDSTGGVRFSRLGITREVTASIRDIFKGNFKWKSAKPQVLIFEKLRVGKIPKKVIKIKQKLLKNGKLTQSEINLFQRYYQLKPTGQAKAIGSTIYAGGRELEVTIAPGEMIRRIKEVGFTYIEKKRVSFVTAEIYKPTKAIAKQIKLANLGKLTNTKLFSLERLLSKKLGRKIKIETPALRKKVSRAGRRVSPDVPVLRIKGTGLYIVIYKGMRVTRRKSVKGKRVTKKVGRKIGRKPIARKRPVKKTTRRKTIVRKSSRIKKVPRPKRPAKRPLRKRSTRPVKRPIKRPAKRPAKTPSNKKPPIRGKRESFPIRKLSREVPVYYVVMRVKGKKRKLSPRPFTMKDAKDYLAYRVDHGLSRTAWFEPIGKVKKVRGLPKSIQGYYSKNKRKLRPYKIRVGKRKALRNGFIEKNKFIQDTPSERRALRIAKERKTVRKRTTKRKITQIQRRRMLANLKKARKIRMRNIWKRR
jgi:hypothetical protein